MLCVAVADAGRSRQFAEAIDHLWSCGASQFFFFWLLGESDGYVRMKSVSYLSYLGYLGTTSWVSWFGRRLTLAACSTKLAPLYLSSHTHSYHPDYAYQSSKFNNSSHAARNWLYGYFRGGTLNRKKTPLCSGIRKCLLSFFIFSGGLIGVRR